MTNLNCNKEGTTGDETSATTTTATSRGRGGSGSGSVGRIPYYTALSSIVPAVASTACCWGPALLSIVGGSTSILSTVSKYRPHLLTLSASMISYSFYNVYYGRNNELLLVQSHDNNNNNNTAAAASCCNDNSSIKEENHNNHQINKAVVWLSLGVAIAGASYGRGVSSSSFRSTKKMFFNNNNTKTTFRMSGGTNLTTTTNGSNALLHHHQLHLHHHHRRLKVDGMHCNGCANKVRKAIIQQEGIIGVVEDILVDHSTGYVTIVQQQQQQQQATSTKKDDDHDLGVIIKAIEKAGFQVVQK